MADEQQQKNNTETENKGAITTQTLIAKDKGVLSKKALGCLEVMEYAAYEAQGMLDSHSIIRSTENQEKTAARNLPLTTEVGKIAFTECMRGEPVTNIAPPPPETKTPQR